MTTNSAHRHNRCLGMALARRRARRSSARATLAVTTVAAIALASGSAALAAGPSPFAHQQARHSTTADASRIPHTAGLTAGQIAQKAQRHQRAINRAASQSPVPAVAAPLTPGRDALPIVLAGVALLVAVGSVAVLAVGGARIRRSVQPGA
jgi:hypothetical protein